MKSSVEIPVYDLSVEGAHEFFANCVLVHNSWRDGQHDDLVLAVALACWLGENVGGGNVNDIALPPEGQRNILDGAPEGVFAI